MKMDFSLSFANKMLLTVVTSCMVIAIIVTFIALKTANDSFSKSITSYRQSLYSDFDGMSQKQVRQAISTLQIIHGRYMKGELPYPAAKQQAEDFLRDVRYDKDGYFWGYSPDGVAIVMLGKKDIEGKNRWDLKDTKGNFLIRDIVKEGMKPDGGFVEYWFPKPGDPKPLPKRSFNMYFKPFNLIVGTGNYIDDLEEMVAKQVETNKKELRNGVFRIISATLIVLIMISFGSIHLTRRLLREHYNYIVTLK